MNLLITFKWNFATCLSFCGNRSHIFRYFFTNSHKERKDIPLQWNFCGSSEHCFQHWCVDLMEVVCSWHSSRINTAAAFLNASLKWSWILLHSQKKGKVFNIVLFIHIQIPPMYISPITQYPVATTSWSTFEGTLRVLYSYCMCSSSCHSSRRVPSKELQLAVSTAVLRYVRPTWPVIGIWMYTSMLNINLCK